jgi:hypothetical protein
MKKYQNLSTSELQTLQTLEAEVALLDKHQAQSRISSVSEAVKVARDAYVKSPTDANLENYKARLREEAHQVFPPHTNGQQIAVTIETAKKAFVENKLRPFTAPILERALNSARRNFESVKKSESAKIEAATGHPYHDGIRSKPIDEASAAVVELEALSAAIAATTSFFAKFREAFASA